MKMREVQYRFERQHFDQQIQALVQRTLQSCETAQKWRITGRTERTEISLFVGVRFQFKLRQHCMDFAHSLFDVVHRQRNGCVTRTVQK